MDYCLFRIKALAAFALALLSVAANAAVGLTEIPSQTEDYGPVTVFYPSSGDEAALTRGPFTLSFAWQGKPERGNGRLIVVSHGSGGSPWVHSNLARVLVEQGFIVAIPEHYQDNYNDPTNPGPDSWKLRPAEVSRAIDAVGRDARFAPLLALDKVGMYGMSAGGHTALTLAGGRWSPKQLLAHCETNITEDFHGCVGLSTRLTGGFFDGAKKRMALWVIRQRFNDSAWYAHTDPRVAAIVSGVPVAADFDVASLAEPRVPLALITAQQDKWLAPRFHSGAILNACKTCELLVDFPNGGHGALLSPLRPKLPGLLGHLLNDPPGFDRSALPETDRKIAAFFGKHLL